MIFLVSKNLVILCFLFSYDIAIADQVLVGNSETQKRQRRWNTESLKVPERQSSDLTPKDSFVSSASKRNFSRSESTVSEDATKERVGEHHSSFCWI